MSDDCTCHQRLCRDCYCRCVEQGKELATVTTENERLKTQRKVLIEEAAELTAERDEFRGSLEQTMIDRDEQLATVTAERDELLKLWKDLSAAFLRYMDKAEEPTDG